MDEGCIDYKREIYACPHCKGEITDKERTIGRWYDQNDKEVCRVILDKISKGGLL